MANIKYYLLYAPLKLLAMLPLGVLYVLSGFLSFLAHRVVKYRVKVVRRNLANAFPEKSGEELRAIEKEFYRHLCDVIVETVKLLHISNRQLQRRVTITNPGLLIEEMDRGGSIILYLGHYANWEWLPTVALSLRSDMKMGALYKPLLDKTAARITDRLRGRFGILLVPTRKAYRTLLEMKREEIPFIMGFIADQRPLGQPIHHWTRFLHQPTAFVAGGETIGERVGARYLYADMQKIKRGYYTITFKRMEISPDDKSDFPYTRLFFRMLEQSIRNAPPYWLWSHNRWKARPPEGLAIPE